MKDRLFDVLMPLLPKNDLSHLVGRLVHTRLPQPLARKSVEIFAKIYKINLSEAEFPVGHYESIGALFTRRLKPGVRPIGQGLVHPADAVITQCGQIEKQAMIQAKGKTYTVAELLGGRRRAEFAQAFEGGSYLTYYLCPTDYHRVHSPVDGEITEAIHTPGELWPVNSWSVNAIERLFTVNERISVMIETPHGRVALVMVAATNVGNMSMSFDASISTEVRAKKRSVNDHCYRPAKPIHRGEEVGIFHMGSTVVMLYEKRLLEAFEIANVSRYQNVAVKMGAEV